ncbi:MAG TPA: metalloregulator ArsR/SmtB family transcription factor [Sporolactobacillaceae bacterium]|nr:metalloregulator ArsR/SmtB family transcription factor [Sporolactobacillaceae bacterium]
MTDIYQALSDPTRRKILSILSGRHCAQKDIVEHFEISQPAILKHLRVLKEAGMIQEKKEGKYRVYTLDKDNFSVAYQQMVREMEAILDNQLYRLKHFLESEEDQK